MGAMASQITGVSIVSSTVCSGAYHGKHQSSASLVFVRGIHGKPVNSPHKGPVTRKLFPLMTSSCNENSRMRVILTETWIEESRKLFMMLSKTHAHFFMDQDDVITSALLVLCEWIHRSSVDSCLKGQWRGALTFSLICTRTNDWANNRDADDLRHNRAHYDVTVIYRENRKGGNVTIAIRNGVMIFESGSGLELILKYVSLEVEKTLELLLSLWLESSIESQIDLWKVFSMIEWMISEI